MTKRDSSRTFWCIISFVHVYCLICATLSSAQQDAMTICQRIQSNDLKIRTMGLVAEMFIVLTSEGHLFYLPKANLRDVDTPSTTLTINNVPVRANRVFGVELDYSVRDGYLFFLVMDGKSKLWFLMILQVRSHEVFLQAFHLDYMLGLKGHNPVWADARAKPDKTFDFNPDYIVNRENSPCSSAIRKFQKSLHFNSYEYFTSVTQRICLKDDSLRVIWIEKDLDSCESDRRTDGPTILTGFVVGQTRPGEFNLFSDGYLTYWNYSTATSDGQHLYEYQLSNFIRCGPNFTDFTQRLEPPMGKVVHKATDQSNTDKLTTRISGWVNATGGTLVIAIGGTLAILAAVVIFILIKEMSRKKRKPKRKHNRKHNRKHKREHSSHGSNASSAIGSKVSSSIGSSVGGSSACSSLAASSGTSSAIQSTVQSPSAGHKSKSKHQTSKDTVFGLFEKNKKKNAEQRSKVKKTKNESNKYRKLSN